MPAPEEVTQTGIPPLVRRGLEAFRRELPELLRQKKLDRRWVAYHGEKRLGFARSKTKLYEECLRLGLKPGEFVLRCIIPDIPPDADVTPSFDV